MGFSPQGGGRSGDHCHWPLSVNITDGGGAV
jgi:hypothetical protein